MKVLICGAFDFVNLPCGGQPVKTRELYYALVRQYGKNEVCYVDTYGWKKRPFTLLYKLLKYSKKSQNLIMLPAHNGVIVFSSLFFFLKKWWNKRIYYDVIGGWLPELLKEKPKLVDRLKAFDGIWVETSSMKKALQIFGFQNIDILHNFKKLQAVDSLLNYQITFPLKVCLFSRIQEEKGVEDAINAIREINNKKGKVVYALDLYGPIDSDYESKFDRLKNEFPDYITYKGVINPNKSVEVLQYYYALLFPTHYETEGVPGTIIDAYASALPVVSARWINSGDIIDEGKSGLCYQFGDYSSFLNILEELSENPDLLLAMRPYCLKKYKEFSPEGVMQQIRRFLE